jgi:signal transduction histidine kinase
LSNFQLAIALAAVPAGLLVFGHDFDATGQGVVIRWLQVVIGWSFIYAGVGVWRRRPENPIGRAMVITGALVWISVAFNTGVPLVWTVTTMMNSAFLASLIYTILVYPTGRLGWWLPQLLVWCCILAETLAYVVTQPFYDPHIANPSLKSSLNLLLIEHKKWFDDLMLRIAASLVMVVLLICIAIICSRWVRASRTARRVYTPILLPAAIVCAAYFTYLAFQQATAVYIYKPPTVAYQITLDALFSAMAILPIAYLVGLIALRVRRGRVGDLAVQLAEVVPRQAPSRGRRVRWLQASILVAAVPLGLAFYPLTFESYEQGPLIRWMTIAIGWAFIGGGVVAWWRRPENRLGKLLIVTGAFMWLGFAFNTRVPILWTFLSLWNLAPLVPFMFVLLAYPTGRLGWWLPRSIVGLTVLAQIINGFALAPLYDPRAEGCATCPKHLNLLLIENRHSLVVWWAGRAGDLVAAALFGCLVFMVVRWVRASNPGRRVLSPMFLPATVYCLAHFSYIEFGKFAGPSNSVYVLPRKAFITMFDTMFATLLLLPIAFLIGLSRLRSRRARVADLVTELRDGGGSQGGAQHPVRDAVARTLGDEGAEIGLWLPDLQVYVDEDGATVALPAPDDSLRVATGIARNGERVAIIVHDAALLEEEQLVRGVGAAAALALENARLQSELRAQLEEVRASRARIVTASDAARQTIERDLHDGAQQQLVGLSMLLEMAHNRADDPAVRELIHDAKRDLERAINELRELARGVHPAVLTRDGLRAAVAACIDRAPFPIAVSVPTGRFPAPLEATAYFVISEALTNTARYASASKAFVAVEQRDTCLVVEVSDDGVGGAEPTDGSGLRGLDDRVSAVGGQLVIDSPSGRGTRIRATLPLDGP